MRSVRVRSLRLGVTVAVAGVALVASAMAAFAHPAPFTVTAGTAAPGTTVPVTAMAGAILVKDTTSWFSITCNPVTAHGSLSVDSGRSAGSIVELDGAASRWSCPSFGGMKFLITGYGTWHLNVDDVTGGVATGTISNFRAHMVTTAGPTCALDIGASTSSFTSSGTATIDPGTMAANFNNSSHVLAVPGTPGLNSGPLGFWNVKGTTPGYCISPALINQGDRISITASFALTADTAANNPIAIN